MDQFGYLYVSDSDNNRICKITSQGNVTTIAGLGGKGKKFSHCC
jgi:ribosomal protein S11